MSAPVIWTLLYNSVEQTLAQWGLCEPHITRANQASAQLTLTQRGAPYDADLLFAWMGTITLKRNGTPYFVGVVLEPERHGNGSTEEITYNFQDNWWYLENLVYQQSTKSWQGSALPLLDVYSSHVFLGIYPLNLLLKTTGQTITEIVTYAATTCGVPIQLDTTNLPQIEIPYYDERDITCAEAIKKMLRFSPDAVTWVDNSTTPPTLRIKQRANLGTVTVDISQAKQGEEISIHPRHDLQRPSVVINYEISNTFDGLAFTTYYTDAWPTNATGREFRALVSTVNLQGWAITYVNQEVTSTLLTIDQTWWQTHEAKLADPSITILEMSASTRELAWPNEITAGSVTQWMTAAPFNYNFGTDTIRATVKYQTVEGAIHNEVISARVNVTDCPTGKYVTRSSTTFPEGIPVGLAQSFYNAISFLHYEGSFTICEQECSGAYGLGNVLNLTGSRSEFATMAAIIWQTEENLETGETTVNIGPSINLGISDLIELLRVGRYRWTLTNPATQSNAQNGSASTVDLSKNLPKENTNAGGTRYDKFVMPAIPAVPGGAAPGGALTIDATLIGTKQLAIKEVEVCVTSLEGTSVTKKMLTIASEPY